MMATSGVRRSWLTDESSAARRRSVSDSTRDCSRSATSRVRSSAIATWSSSRSSSRRCAGEKVRASSQAMPRTPSRPCRVATGRNSQREDGSVAEPRPAGSPFSQAQSAAERSRTSSRSSGGKPPAIASRPSSPGASRIESHCSAALTWLTAAQTTSSKAAALATLRLKS